MMKVLKEKFPEKYDSGDVEGLPSPILHPYLYSEFLNHKQDFLRDSRYIPDLSFCPGVLTAVPLLRKFCDRMHLLSARWTDQEDHIEALFKKWGISGHFDSKLLRDLRSKKTALEAKLRNALRVGITHMVENDPLIAEVFEKAGIKVVLIARSESEGILNGVNLRKYPDLWYFAIDVGLAGSMEKVFARHTI